MIINYYNINQNFEYIMIIYNRTQMSIDVKKRASSIILVNPFDFLCDAFIFRVIMHHKLPAYSTPDRP